MTDQSNRLGWDPIWRSQIPNRFKSDAAPTNTVVEWAATLAPGSVLLDIGCGVGRHCVYLGQRGFHMAGIDVSSSGVEQTNAACVARGISFDGRIADMTILDWPDNTFDGAFSISSIHHQRRADLVRSLSEVWRVLKPNGSFLVDFPCTDTIDYDRLRQQVADREIREVEPNTFVDERPDTEDIDGYLPHHFCDEADMRDLLKEFVIDRLWAALHPARPERGPGNVGKWVAWAHKPIIA